MKPRQLIGWIIWGVVVLAVFAYIVCMAADTKEVWYVTKPRRTIESPKAAEQSIPMRIRVEEARIVRHGPLRVLVSYYFAAKAIDDWGQESPFSNETAYGWSLGGPRQLTLAWDRSPTTNAVTYKVYKGRSSGVYSNSYAAGTNLTLVVPLFDPAPTNVVVTVSTTNATNLAWASAFTGPWTKLNTTNWSVTNPTAARYFRAISGKKGSTVNIRAQRQ